MLDYLTMPITNNSHYFNPPSSLSATLLHKQRTLLVNYSSLNNLPQLTLIANSLLTIHT